MAVAFGKYQLLQRIGSGGMGQIFLARTVGTQDFEKLLVIKRLLPHLSEDEEFLSMFLDEARIAARLNHPNLIQIFDLGEHAGVYYLAMEYVAGEDLRRLERFLRAQEKLLPLGLLCRIIADVAAGLDYAHKARDTQGRPLNLVHRDVSPQNILVGFDGAVKLIDFGVAKAADKVQHTVSGILKGKYAYMSPEQASGEAVDARSDIFSLGIIFWELLTGKRLFKGETDLTTMRLVAACQVPAPSKFGAPANADALVVKALAREPADRYPDAAAFRLAIEDFILENRLQASTAHLEAFMHGLYKERIAHLADPAALDQLHGNLEQDPGPTPSPVVSQPGVIREISSPRAPLVPPSPVAPVTPQRPRTTTLPDGVRQDVTQEITPAGRRSSASPSSHRGDLWLVIAGLALVAIAVGSALTFALSGPGVRNPPVTKVRRTAPPTPGTRAPESTAPPAPGTPAPESAVPTSIEEPPSALEEPQPVVLKLVSTPPGASVRVGSKELGITPVEYALPADSPPVTAVFTLPGFEPREAVVSARDAPQLSVQLTKKKTKSRVNLDIKTGR